MKKGSHWRRIFDEFRGLDKEKIQATVSFKFLRMSNSGKSVVLEVIGLSLPDSNKSNKFFVGQIRNYPARNFEKRFTKT